MPTFKKMKDVMSYVQRNVINVLSSEEIQEIVKNIMRDVILEEVYNSYMSDADNPYTRRYDNGGFSDTDNYVCKVEVKGNFVSLSIFNDTKGNEDYSGSSSSYYIDKVIYDGKYTWENSDIYKMQPYPRDWIQETIRRLYNSGELMKRLSKKLSAKGIKILN